MVILGCSTSNSGETDTEGHLVYVRLCPEEDLQGLWGSRKNSSVLGVLVSLGRVVSACWITAFLHRVMDIGRPGSLSWELTGNQSQWRNTWQPRLLQVRGTRTTTGCVEDMYQA